MGATIEPNTADPIAVTDEATKALEAELDELGRRHPVPTYDDVRADFLWFHNRCEDGTLDPEGKYAGFNIAISNQEIVGVDCDYLRLRRDLSRMLGVHPERLVIKYLGEWW
jgi:hypothetical protein